MLLTIAIPAHNKSSFLNEAISSIKDEEGFGKDFDIVISDNSLNDKISELYKKKFSQNPYIEHINSKDFDSLDSNVNRSIEISKAKYVWIFGDDDILVPGITKTIVNFLKQNHPDLLVLNSQSFRDSELIESSRLPKNIRNYYSENQNDEFLIDLGGYLTFVGCILVKRKLWIENYNKSKIGSYFAHIDCLASLKKNRKVHYFPNPSIKMRLGSQTWLDKSFQIWYLLYPNIIWGLENYSNYAKEKVITRTPLNSIKAMLAARAYGRINYKIYKKYFLSSNKVFLINKILVFFIVLIPKKFMALIYSSYISFLKKNHNSNFSPKLAKAQLNKKSTF